MTGSKKQTKQERYINFISCLKKDIINTQQLATYDKQLRQIIPTSHGLLEYLVADFVECSDFLQDEMQTFRQSVRCDATNVLS